MREVYAGQIDRFIGYGQEEGSAVLFKELKQFTKKLILLQELNNQNYVFANYVKKLDENHTLYGVVAS